MALKRSWPYANQTRAKAKITEFVCRCAYKPVSISLLTVEKQEMAAILLSRAVELRGHLARVLEGLMFAPNEEILT